MKDSRIIDFFEPIVDPRKNSGNKQHELLDIITISISAVICGAESWNEIERFGKAKKKWLSTFLSLSNGIPSHDTFNRVISAIDPDKFENCFRKWISSTIEKTGDIISIDGKTIRGAKVNGKSPIHMVSAWSSENVVLGQVKVNEKSNEITAIPELLETLAIEGAVVTIDAMGCQKEIANKIIKNRADYVFGLKGNQAALLQEVEDEFFFSKEEKVFEHLDFGHGRIETRKCSVINKEDFDHVISHKAWNQMSSIIKIESTRVFKNKNINEESTRYYITSLNKKPDELLHIVRSHWGVENKLHWMMDVVFSEDYNRKRAGYAAQNFSLINKIALSLLKKDKTTKVGIKSKRKIAGWDEDYLLTVLGF